MSSIPFLVSIPHSGEKVPEFATWLHGLPEETLMCDVDRYVDRLYEPSLKELAIPFTKTEWHRYAGDLNRFPDDVDALSVQGHANAAGKFNRGFLWQITTTELPLMKAPIAAELHQKLVQLIYEPFHASVRDLYAKHRANGHETIYHLDAHSMPSVGTRQHRDPGEHRAEIVVSDNLGKSCGKPYRDLVIAAYCVAGFKVGYNWPYFGGRVTEHYGLPEKGQQAIQVEMNRALYMNETTKKLNEGDAAKVQEKVKKALAYIRANLSSLQSENRV